MAGTHTAWRVYVDIAAAIQQRITNGTYGPGLRIPSEAKLSAEFGVVRNTVRRALTALEREGLIVTVPGHGRVVPHPGATTEETSASTGYRLIAAELRASIGRGEVAPGGRLPSEASLAAAHGASRATVRLALSELMQEGLVEPIQGKGWFVRSD
ncbi:GntR family transcriptional regulator [Cryptosporangium aurantiacum]|uniref:Regulatory protein, gntR family n=1 Tax=Cryptosporangium aurantiacum TaxID=134849 RepID=A0A1M7RL85_9ACTN|nr:GntR family transcriptional regulator [Cryptosporangium aurantiacum]SHN46916.1 regulatory protein, gntR family [Cryptosporangium aurantiacum]